MDAASARQTPPPPGQQSHAPRPMRRHDDIAVDRAGAQLLAQFCEEGDPEIFRRLFEQCGPPLLSILRLRIARARESIDPAELLTDLFARIYRGRQRFEDRGPGSFLRWCTTIADNLIRQQTRDRERRSRREERAARPIHDTSSVPDQNLLRRESLVEASRTCRKLRLAVLEGLSQLSSGQRQVLLLHAQTRMTYAELAARLDLTVGAVTMRMKRGRERLAAHLRATIENDPSVSGDSP